MNPTTLISSAAGRLVTTAGGAAAFVPSPLPPDLTLSWALANAVVRASGSLGYVSGYAGALPNSKIITAALARQDASVSCRLDGAQSPREIANYTAALTHGLAHIRDSLANLELIRQLHVRLYEGIAADDKHPGEFQATQSALDAFEKFLHAQSHLPALVRLALIHYQFEAIHPFLDGNGRVGRLLITLLLQTEKLLDQPLLYLSAFFERNRDEYYERLLAVSRRGAWSEWVDYFLRAVHEQAVDAVDRANTLLALRDEYGRRMTVARQSTLLLAMIDRLFQSPAVTLRDGGQVHIRLVSKIEHMPFAD